MPKPYSYDLRSKAIAAYHSGKKKIEISRYFNIQTEGVMKLEIKGSQKAQIWSLIILSFTAVVGLLGTIATVAIRLFFQKP